MKKILPYIILIVVFCGLFILTQIIETRILYLGFESESGDVIYNHKTSTQKIIFTYGLAICLSILNVVKITKTNFPGLEIRILISSITILIIFLTNFYLSKYFYSDGFNIYDDWRKNLGIDLSIMTMIITTGLSWILNRTSLNQVLAKNK